MEGDATMCLRGKLMAMAEQALDRKAGARPISPDEDLTEAGLASIGLVSLVLAIEAEFDIMIAPADITPDNLRSVVTIEALVTRHVRHSCPAGSSPIRATLGPAAS